MAALVTALTLLTCTWADAGVVPDDVTPHPGHGYQAFSENGFPVADDDFPVDIVTVGPPADGIELEEWQDAVRASLSTWSEVPCSFAELQYAGHRDTLGEVGDNEVPILFAQPSTGPGCLPRDLIGFTSLSACGGIDGKVVHLNDAEFDWSLEPQPRQTFTEDGRPSVVDVESVVTHELGHVLGLSHSDDRLATMHASYRLDGGMRHLAVDDKLGVCSLYEVPNPPPECDTDGDCPGQQSCGMVDQLRLCHEVRGTLGDCCAVDNLICEERCRIRSSGDDTGYCTTMCTNDDDCADGYACEVEVFEDSDASYCVRTPDDGEDPGPCSAVGSARPAPFELLELMCLLVGCYWLRRRGRLSR